MSRFLMALALSCAVAAPAVARQAENWVALGANDAGVQGWYEASAIVRDGNYRRARLRVQPANAPQPNENWVRVDCSQYAVQFLDGERLETAAPISEWSMVDPRSFGGILRDGICSRTP